MDFHISNTTPELSSIIYYIIPYVKYNHCSISIDEELNDFINENYEIKNEAKLPSFNEEKLNLSFDLLDLNEISFGKVKELNISYNNLIFFPDLTLLTSLEDLDISYNLLKDRFYLNTLVKLEKLHIQGNNYDSVVISSLLSCTKELRELNIFPIPFLYENRNYVSLLLYIFPNLQNIDSIDTESYRNNQQKRLSPVLSKDMFDNYSRIKTSSLHLFLPEISFKSVYQENILTLDIQGCNISYIEESDKMNEIKEVNLSYNEIINLDVLLKFKNMEILIMEYNELNNLKLISNYSNLVFVNLNCNNFISFEYLPKLPNLRILLLNYNKIKSLDGVSKFKKLETLELAGNEILNLELECERIKEMLFLKNLTLADNPITNNNDYRMYFIYHMPQLKVLDNTIISKIEIKYSNTILSDNFKELFYTEYLDSRTFVKIKELVLSQCRMKISKLLYA